jgi:hypothetical protein
MLTNKDSNLKVLVAIPPVETEKDDAQNAFLTKHIIPFLRKVELNIQSLLMKQFYIEFVPNQTTYFCDHRATMTAQI